jgi:hypothetical protein
MTVTNNIYQKQIKYHVFNAVTNSELTELVPVFTIQPAFPTSVKKVNTSFKNVWRTWGPTLLADLMIFGPMGPTNFKNSAISKIFSSETTQPNGAKHGRKHLCKVSIKFLRFVLFANKYGCQEQFFFLIG